MAEKVLITGATGFIGRALLNNLREQGVEAIGVGSVDGDIAEPATLAPFAGKAVSRIFHLAGRTYVPDSWTDPQAFFHTNVLGTTNILEYCRKNDTSLTFVSAYVYGQPDTLPIGESCNVHPNNPYAISKLLAEEVCRQYAETFHVPVAVVRPFNIYGTGQKKTFLIPTIIKQALGSGEIVVQDLTPRRDFLYINDLVTALSATRYFNRSFDIYNLGSGYSLSVKDIIDQIQDVIGTRKKIVCRQTARPNEVLDVVADIAKARRDLSWSPEYSFMDGIKEIIELELEKK